MSNHIHCELNESEIQKVSYPDLANVRYDENSN
jgi:hypothetical protein